MDPLRVHIVVKPFGATTGYTADFAVDALHTELIAPAFELVRAGIQPTGRAAFEMADGSMRDYPFAFVLVEILGTPAVGRAIFGPDDAEPVIGNLLFASAGFAIDPDTQQIERRPLRL